SALAELGARCAELNARRFRRVTLTGPGTELTLSLPPRHRWCTARLHTRSGSPFVANLPTAEVFTAPDCRSAEGTLAVARPVVHGGVVMDRITLEFRRGAVVRADARTGRDWLRRLLDTDAGARRLGEVALVPACERRPPPRAPRTWRTGGRLFHHPLLDENAAPHVAMGEAYGFTSEDPAGEPLNRSHLHLDLPMEAQAVFD
ncbi:MAG: aminopeptidase, partial [Opitutaceae bacterium]|nr:aminopeptidase [Opitutaceae bacterium]